MMKFIASVAALSALAASPASAVTLNGDDIVVSYMLNGASVVFGSFTAPQTNITVTRDPSGSGSIGGNMVSYLFGRNVSFDSLGLSSVTFTDTNSAKTITGAAFTSGTTVNGFTANALSFSAHSFTVDFSGITASKGQAIDLIASASVSPVPLPPTAPMFGAALLALGALGYRQKRKAATAC